MQKYLCTYISFNVNGQLCLESNKVIVVNDEGLILSIEDENENDKSVIDLSQFIMIPAIADLHLHSSQLDIMGIGYDTLLDNWFQNTLYPAEEYYDQDGNYSNINRRLVNELWKYGILLSSIFCSIEVGPAIDLMNCVEESGMSAYIGKMNADRAGFNKPRETTEESIARTLRLIEHTVQLSDRVNAILSPEFIPAVSSRLFKELANIAKKYQLTIQTHFAEGTFDYELVNHRYPNLSYAQAYLEEGVVVPGRTLFVHGVSANETDIEVLRENDITLVHCPTALSDNPSDSNINIANLINNGVKVGYGSDIGGSGTLNPFHNMVAMTRYSNIVATERGETSINIWDSFKIMTKQNGAFFGKYGVIEPGYHFSVIVIDDTKVQSISNKGLKERFLRYIYNGSIEQIKYRFHNGVELLKPYNYF